MQKQGADDLQDDDLDRAKRVAAQCFGSDGALAAWERDVDTQHRVHMQRIHGVRVGVERLADVLKEREHAARAAQQLEANQLRSQLGAAQTRAEAGERRECERDAARQAELQAKDTEMKNLKQSCRNGASG